MFLFWERVWGVFGLGAAQCCDQAHATVQDTDESNVTEMAHKFMKISELIKAERKANEKILHDEEQLRRMTAAKAAKDDAQRIEAATAVAAAKKVLPFQPRTLHLHALSACYYL